DKPEAQTFASADNGLSDFRAADAALRQAHTPEDVAHAATMLWAAVTNGSSDAEVELADVYGRGVGVRRNCQQALILLNAAREHSNPRADQESDTLRSYGCR